MRVPETLLIRLSLFGGMIIGSILTVIVLKGFSS